MSELTLTLLRFLFLAGLWVLVLAIVGVLRSDLYGTRIRRISEQPATGGRRSRRERRAEAAARQQPRRPERPPVTPPGGVVTDGDPAATAAAGGLGAGGLGAALGRGRRRRGQDAQPRRLVVTGGRMTGTSIPLKGSAVTIGRAPDCTLVLDDDYASGHHARLLPRDGGWSVEDLGSTNGTLLGGHRLTGPTPVGPGSALRIGQTVIELQG